MIESMFKIVFVQLLLHQEDNAPAWPYCEHTKAFFFSVTLPASAKCGYVPSTCACLRVFLAVRYKLHAGNAAKILRSQIYFITKTNFQSSAVAANWQHDQNACITYPYVDTRVLPSP